VQENECVEQNTSNTDVADSVVADSESNEIRRFELLRNELIELEKRVQRSADQSENEEVHLKVLSCLYIK
jgi:hypothetical protein